MKKKWCATQIIRGKKMVKLSKENINILNIENGAGQNEIYRRQVFKGFIPKKTKNEGY